jgi:hypothetical protein
LLAVVLVQVAAPVKVEVVGDVVIMAVVVVVVVRAVAVVVVGVVEVGMMTGDMEARFGRIFIFIEGNHLVGNFLWVVSFSME